MPEVKEFIENYDDSRESEIRFAWNGKHAAEFQDANDQFRRQVFDSIMDCLDTIDLQLLRDVFRAETQFSKEAWVIDFRVSKLAEALLRRGGAAYVGDYLVGRLQGFDAYCACGMVSIDIELARELLRAVERHLTSETDAGRRKLWQFGKDTFGKWVEHLRTQKI